MTAVEQEACREFPASVTVHWPTGPVNVCEKHADQLVGLARFMGTHVGVTKLEDDAQCSNCVSESKPK